MLARVIRPCYQVGYRVIACYNKRRSGRSKSVPTAPGNFATKAVIFKKKFWWNFLNNNYFQLTEIVSRVVHVWGGDVTLHWVHIGAGTTHATGVLDMLLEWMIALVDEWIIDLFDQVGMFGCPWLLIVLKWYNQSV